MMQQHGVLGCRGHPHAATGAVLLEVYFVRCPEVDRSIFHHPLEFFLCAFCRSGSACAIAGRGLRSRKPNCRNRRWHCRTPKSILYSRSIQVASVLRSEEHTSELQSRLHLVCRLLLEKKKISPSITVPMYPIRQQRWTISVCH